jgi:ABC-type multidrug transport system fused ATPase/permease subunit
LEEPHDLGPRISWAEIRQQIFSHKRPLVRAHLLALLATLVSVPLPLMMPLLIDEVLLAQPGPAVQAMDHILPHQWQSATGYIFAILFVVCIMRLASLVFSVAQNRQFTLIGKEISWSIRSKLLQQLPLIALKEYETQGSAGISSRCITDVETLDKFISESLSKLLISLMTIVGTGAILLWLDWRLGLIILLLNPAVIYFSRAFGQQVKHLKKDENAAFERFQQSLVETLDAINQLRTAQREKQYFERVSDAATLLKHAAISSSWKTDAASRFSFTIFLLGFECFRAVAMLMVVFSGLSIGEIFAVFGYLWFMMGPIQDLLNMQYSYFGAQAAIKRLNELFKLEQEPHYPCSIDPFSDPQAQIGIELKNVDFSYQVDKPLLKQVSFVIPAGQKVAVVSVSGGGKSTLVQLLLGLYQKQSGEICYNGIPIEHIGFERIRSRVATVLQQPMLFNSSVRDNLCMGSQHTDDEIWQALTMAELQTTIQSLDDGLETLIGRNGVRLSGGQRQRLAIARMILSRPQIVILDEATSALDTETENQILTNLNQFLSGRTTLIIAHRLSAIRQADWIYVLDDGVMTQSGHHNDLIEQQGLYQTLYGH